MLQLRRELNLATESVDAYPLRHIVLEHLDDDPALERAILREEHAAHPSATELPLECVGVAQRPLECCPEVRRAALNLVRHRGETGALTALVQLPGSEFTRRRPAGSPVPGVIKSGRPAQKLLYRLPVAAPCRDSLAISQYQKLVALIERLGGSNLGSVHDG